MSWERIRTLAAGGAVAGAALVAGACGGGSAEGARVAGLGGTTTGGTTATTSTGASSDDPQEVVLEYTRCMRKEGIDLPDPDFSSGSRGGFRIRLGPGGTDPNDPDFREAQETCGPILDDLRQELEDPERREELQRAALEFARCMREHGIDMPDPSPSGARPGGGGGGGGVFRSTEIDPDDPDFRAAQEECEDAFDGLGGRMLVPGSRRERE